MEFVQSSFPWLSIVCIIAPLVAAFGTLLFPKENATAIKLTTTANPNR